MVEWTIATLLATIILSLIIFYSDIRKYLASAPTERITDEMRWAWTTTILILLGYLALETKPYPSEIAYLVVLSAFAINDAHTGVVPSRGWHAVAVGTAIVGTLLSNSNFTNSISYLANKVALSITAMSVVILYAIISILAHHGIGGGDIKFAGLSGLALNHITDFVIFLAASGTFALFFGVLDRLFFRKKADQPTTKPGLPTFLCGILGCLIVKYYLPPLY